MKEGQQTRRVRGEVPKKEVVRRQELRTLGEEEIRVRVLIQ